jgi:hypothetical protein
MLMFLSLVALTACGNDKTKDDDVAAKTKAPAPQSPDDYRKQQMAFADSVLNESSPPAAVARKMGKGYEVGSTRLRDTVAVIAQKTDCFATARKSDPYLAGTVSFWVNMSVIGSDNVQVQESKWTSAAGNIVDACLNGQSKSWKFDATFGKPAAYIVQVQFK